MPEDYRMEARQALRENVKWYGKSLVYKWKHGSCTVGLVMHLVPICSFKLYV